MVEKFLPNTQLDGQNALLGTENFLLVNFEFLGDVTLGIGTGLLANPLGRYFVFVGVTHLDVVAKDVVVTHSE